MFSRVLFPTDFSTYANTIFACLPQLQVMGMREVMLLSVIRPADVPLPETYNRDSLEFWQRSLEEQLNIARMALERNGLRVSTRVEYGNPAKKIVEVAEEAQVDMIVISAQGMTILKELLIGSVAYDTLRHMSVPGLLLKAEVVHELGHVRCRFSCTQMFKRVLHPTDFSDCAQSAFQVVQRLKAVGTQEVFVLHVQDKRVMKLRSPEQIAEFDRHDTERLEALCQSLAEVGIEATPILRHGIPFQEAMKVAEEINPSLIVLGSQGRSAIREMLAGSTFENLIRVCRQPVLAIPPAKG